MLKQLFRAISQWWRKLFGKRKSANSAERLAAVRPLEDAEFEYLFLQLLEGVTHGWQQPRVAVFFSKIKNRASKAEWLTWLRGFGDRLLASGAPNYDLADRMLQLSQLDCGEIGDVSGEIAYKLINRDRESERVDIAIANNLSNFGEVPRELMGVDLPPEPSGWFSTNELGDLAASKTFQPIDPTTNVGDFDKPLPDLIPTETTPEPTTTFSLQDSPIVDDIPVTSTTEVREITIEELSEMLHKDPDLVRELSQQLGIVTDDPAEIVKTIIAQMAANPHSPSPQDLN
jgi:hypothetical protein